jgi:hypothetical protein
MKTDRTCQVAVDLAGTKTGCRPMPKKYIAMLFRTLRQLRGPGGVGIPRAGYIATRLLMMGLRTSQVSLTLSMGVHVQQISILTAQADCGSFYGEIVNEVETIRQYTPIRD